MSLGTLSRGKNQIEMPSCRGKTIKMDVSNLLSLTKFPCARETAQHQASRVKRWD